jgi:SAM domain (Sterile alpha motif)
MDIVVWLRGLGLGKYEAAFRENEIDETVLPSLTHETLKELGVTAVRNRLKLLDAIAALRTETGSKASSADAATTSSAPRRISRRPSPSGDGDVSPTWWAQQRSQRAWTLKICARLFPPTRSASHRPCSAAAAS